MVTKTFSGGEALEAKLREIADKVGKAKTVNVGFMAGATYPDGTPVAYIAYVNEYGGTAKVPEHDVTVNRSIKADGTFNQNGRFVRAEKANFSTVHKVEAYTVKTPARPFFRGMIQKNKGDWPADLGKIIKATNYDSTAALGLLGKHISEQLQESIRDFASPSNADSTVANKGFDKPLIETSHMLNSVDSEIQE